MDIDLDVKQFITRKEYKRYLCSDDTDKLGYVQLPLDKLKILH